MTSSPKGNAMTDLVEHLQGVLDNTALYDNAERAIQEAITALSLEPKKEERFMDRKYPTLESAHNRIMELDEKLTGAGLSARISEIILGEREKTIAELTREIEAKNAVLKVLDAKALKGEDA